MTENDEQYLEVMSKDTCFTLPPDFAEATDFKAEEAINLDMDAPLPDNFTLGNWVFSTQDQTFFGSCTAMATTHSTQLLAVKHDGVEPTTSDIIKPDRKDLWAKMGHSTTKYDGGDYVEKAVSTALKQGIATASGGVAKFDGYAYGQWGHNKASLDILRRYIYQGSPVVWAIQGDTTTWREMRAGEVKTVPGSNTTGHAIAFVGFDRGGFWVLNSWTPNDGIGRKCRFYISDETLIKYSWRLNYRYWVLYTKEEAKTNPEYLKRKNQNLLVLQVLKKNYNEEPQAVKDAIVTLSQALRKAYPELNEELPL